MTQVQTWAHEEALSAQLYRRLAHAARLHEHGEGPLWRDPDLSVARAWRMREQPTAAWAERYGGDFEAAMRFLHESEAASADRLVPERPAREPEREHAAVVAVVPAERGRRGWLVFAGWILIALGVLLALLSALASVVAMRDATAAAADARASSIAAQREHVAAMTENAQAQRARRAAQAAQTAAQAAQAAAAVAASRAERAVFAARASAVRAAKDEADADADLAADARAERRPPPPKAPASPRNPVIPHVPVVPHAPARGAFRDEACHRALIYQRTAAATWVTPLTAYNAAMAGLAMNNHCSAPRRDVNEAYLLAARAPAESGLGIGDWRRDLLRSDALLAQCVARPQYRRGIASDCASQLRYNERFRRELER